MKRQTFLRLFPVLLSPVLLPGCATLRKKRSSALPERGLCAHRGAMATHPENTIASFTAAVRAGAHMMEFDVYLSKDGHPVVIHDPTVDRTTDGKGAVAELTLAELKRLDAGSRKSPSFRGEHIPTLEETLDVMPRNIWLNVHLKGGEELGRTVTTVLVHKKRFSQSFLACGSEAIRGARTVEPDILHCNMDRQTGAWEYIDDTIAKKSDFIQLLSPYTPEFREYTKKLKENGVRINCFGTDSYDELRLLFEAGVDFPLVNDIVATMQAVKDLGIKPAKPLFS